MTSPLAIFGLILAAIVYMTGYKGVIGIAVVFISLLGLVYTQQNKLLYMPGIS